MDSNCKNLLHIREGTHQTPSENSKIPLPLHPPLIYFHVPTLELLSKEGEPDGEKPNPNPSSRPEALSAERWRERGTRSVARSAPAGVRRVFGRAGGGGWPGGGGGVSTLRLPPPGAGRLRTTVHLSCVWVFLSSFFSFFPLCCCWKMFGFSYFSFNLFGVWCVFKSDLVRWMVFSDPPSWPLCVRSSMWTVENKIG